MSKESYIGKVLTAEEILQGLEIVIDNNFDPDEKRYAIEVDKDGRKKYIRYRRLLGEYETDYVDYFVDASLFSENQLDSILELLDIQKYEIVDVKKLDDEMASVDELGLSIKIYQILKGKGIFDVSQSAIFLGEQYGKKLGAKTHREIVYGFWNLGKIESFILQGAYPDHVVFNNIETLGLSEKAISELRKADINTICELIDTPLERLLTLNGLLHVDIMHIVNKLRELPIPEKKYEHIRKWRKQIANNILFE